jgi:hypothetical protein
VFLRCFGETAILRYAFVREPTLRLARVLMACKRLLDGLVEKSLQNIDRDGPWARRLVE